MNLSTLNSMKLDITKSAKSQEKDANPHFFKTSGESRKSVKGDMGTRKTNLCNAIQFTSSSSSSSSYYYYYYYYYYSLVLLLLFIIIIIIIHYYYYYYYYYSRFFLCFSFCISFRFTDRLTDHHSRSPGQSLLSNTFSS